MPYPDCNFEITTTYPRSTFASVGLAHLSLPETVENLFQKQNQNRENGNLRPSANSLDRPNTHYRFETNARRLTGFDSASTTLADVIARLAVLLASERRLARIHHPAYDVSRHLALLEALRHFNTDKKKPTDPENTSDINRLF
jgi:hypothetical protein